MNRWMRPLTLVFVFALVAWLPQAVPSSIGEAGDRTSSAFTLGHLIKSVVDPLAPLIAVACALFFGGWRGLGRAACYLVGGAAPQDASHRLATARALKGAARGWLWGIFVLNLVYVVSFYRPEPPYESQGLLSDGTRIGFVQGGALFAAGVSCLVVLPHADVLAERGESSRTLRAIDGIALLGLAGCALTVILSIFVYEAPKIGGEPRVAYVQPSFESIDAAFVGWSATVVCVLSAIALTPFAGSSADGSIRFCRTSVGRAALAAGVLVAVIV